jgi:hypothetical protein
MPLRPGIAALLGAVVAIAVAAGCESTPSSPRSALTIDSRQTLVMDLSLEPMIRVDLVNRGPGAVEVVILDRDGSERLRTTLERRRELHVDLSDVDRMRIAGVNRTRAVLDYAITRPGDGPVESSFTTAE